MGSRGHIVAGILLCLLSIMAPGRSSALAEDEVFARLASLVEDSRTCEADPSEEFWTVKIAVSPVDGYRLRYSRFGCAPGSAGVVLLAPGRSEPSYEYHETAIDLITRGYEPVYVIDHRGQGLSPRLLDDPSKGHIDDFSTYIDDLDLVVEDIRAEMIEIGGEETPLYFISNSMGGAIGIGHLQRSGEASPFQAAALLGAMLHINYLSYTDHPPSWLNLRIYSEQGVLFQSGWRCGLGEIFKENWCQSYASPDTFGPYRKRTRTFRQGREQMMTQSEERFGLRTHFWDNVDWSEMATRDYTDGEIWTGPQLGGATNGWVGAAARFNGQIRKQRNLEAMTHVPILLMTGTRDLRAYRQYALWRGVAPDLSRHQSFCDSLNEKSRASGAGHVCTFIAVNGGFHELLKERDKERNFVIDTIDWFFRANSD